MLTIDGSYGEGGGQVLRSALALSVVTRTPFRITRIRAGRERPGLLRQHLTAVQAAAAVSGAELTGAELKSRELTFAPRGLRAGAYHFDVGSAGSATLVLQTLSLPLLFAPGATRVTVDGGTHNPFAPPFEYFADVYLPALRRMGARCEATLKRYGFYPAGGGRVALAAQPCERLAPIELLDRGAVRACSGVALVANLPLHIATRELRVVHDRLGWPLEALRPVEVADTPGPGNVLLLAVECEHVTEMFVGFGQKRVRAETVAARAVEEVAAYLAAGAPVGPHLADQLLLPLALAGGGAFRTTPLTRHAETNLAVIRKFLDVDAQVAPAADGTVVVRVQR